MMLMTGIFFSCVNDLDKVKKITTHPENPDDTSEELHIIYTDSGYAQFEIFANIAETYGPPQNVRKFKDGLRVNFYNDDGSIGSVLTSLFGEINDETGLITVRDSVKLLNVVQEKTLESEVLYYNKTGDSIYTNKAVVITSPDLILTGIGAWTTPAFDTAQFYKPTAKIFIKD
ncbi:LPS export ABC transporter periplasmic protein LptC [Brumimicrobium oceani]|uniref:LPS export ABC transporter periplasmic protein LptC n=2 Tax=Brumimicrobium oceani TaxID=2100725 RepID=A0A2U2XDY6_9FLAO|nr:LPS export ABC transporter periplasmic protein LptC [Brumimicrobium oceani]PWH85957.1 LPS export ABC transporter periplasmic protein LptC [Brumimicrobium oceani]